MAQKDDQVVTKSPLAPGGNTGNSGSNFTSPEPDRSPGRFVRWLIILLLTAALFFGAQALFSGSGSPDQRLDQLQAQIDELKDQAGDGLSADELATLNELEQAVKDLQDETDGQSALQTRLNNLNKQIDNLQAGAQGPAGGAGLSTNVTLQGNSFNGASQLVQTTAGGLLPALTGANLTNLTGANVSGTVANATTAATTSGNAATATALAADPTDCGANAYANTIAASGDLTCAAITDASLSANVALLDGSQTFTGSPLFKNSADSPTALRIQNAAGTTTLFLANTTTGVITIDTLSVSQTLTVSGSLSFGTTISSTCAGLTGYVWVPGNAKFGTMPGFCVMQYEAKNVGGVATSQADSTPWVSISQRTAQDRSREACDGCHLITEPEWMTIATDVLWVDENWSGGTVGTGCLFRGNVGNDDACGYNGSDPEFGTGRDTKARLTLSTGEHIWDLSGNVWEWTDAWVQGKEQPNDGVDGFAWHQYTAITDFKGLQYLNPTNRGWNLSQGIGQIFTDGTSSNDTQYAFRRGGTWYDTTNAGVFSLGLSSTPTFSNSDIGFRVSR